MKYKKINIILPIVIVLLLIACVFISYIYFRNKQSSKVAVSTTSDFLPGSYIVNTTDPSKVLNNLQSLTLKNSIFKTVHDQYLLLGQTQSQIEAKYTYTRITAGRLDKIIMQKKYPTAFIDESALDHDLYGEIYTIDACTRIMYKDGHVFQVALNNYDDIESLCINSGTLTKSMRLELFGTEDLVEYSPGLPYIANYVYVTKGFSILKFNSIIQSIWLTLPMSINNYHNYYGSDFQSSDEILSGYPVLSEQRLIDKNGNFIAAYPEK